MTHDSKTALLVAYDALSGVAVGEPVVPGAGRTSTHGGSARCDACHSSHASPDSALACPIGKALMALTPMLPAFFERARWLEPT